MDKSFDMNGRPYARFGEVKEGTILIADGGFNDPIEGNDDHFCIKDGDELVVKLDVDFCIKDGDELVVKLDVDFYLGFYLKE